MTDNLPRAGYRELLLLLLRRRKRFKVSGESMLPLLQPGEEVMLDPFAYRQSPPKLNDIVVAVHPERTERIVIKRITAISCSGEYFLTGDNLAASTDSRHWGSVEAKSILGKAIGRFL